MFIFECNQLHPEQFRYIVKEFTDSEIVECLRNRQSYVVKYLSERYLPMIRLMVIHMGGSDDDAADIFQDGLIIMLEKIDNKNFNLSCKFKTYLYCVCEHLWKTVLDKRTAASNYLARRDEADDEKDFTESIDHKLYEEIFNEAFERLDSTSKSILNLYWQEMSPHDIANKLGLTYGYVRKKKSEAQSELMEIVKKNPGYRKIIKTESKVREVVV